MHANRMATGSPSVRWLLVITAELQACVNQSWTKTRPRSRPSNRTMPLQLNIPFFLLGDKICWRQNCTRHFLALGTSLHDLVHLFCQRVGEEKVDEIGFLLLNFKHDPCPRRLLCRLLTKFAMRLGTIWCNNEMFKRADKFDYAKFFDTGGP